ncbi:MAG: TetR/AcrR family transcriptional regulator [Roseibium sp.]|uniref:TetR/AcrR family transcriptional regulator n=1 Tax=Roseibium sp. TaxID=1936156 RepID=UPI001B0C7293|nr:TetR/AcrR family transcriptional regulator [Roseibium sp.]MBO6892591.1 TetR/AcrR family transcriptional regulator [Roseibium sp.]MBO6928279.1 TetR/AcrR family transcriptional regulator [Roseibium sp.]
MSEKQSRAEAADARRQHIVQTAVICFIEQGFHQTSIRDIAKRAGVSLGNIYNHFDSKSALIAEIATIEASDLEKMQDALSAASPPRTALDSFVTRYLDYCSKPAHTALTVEILAEAVRDPKIADGFGQNRDHLLAALEGQIAKVQQDLKAENALAPQDCAEFILDLIEGLAMRAVFSGRKATDAEIKALRTAIDRIL